VRDSLKAALLTRAMVFALGFFAVATFGPAPEFGPASSSALAALPGRWDASWYLGIASGGYRWDGPDHNAVRPAFFPAYPLALRGAARLLRLPDAEPPWLWTGVALSTLFFWIGLQYLHRLTELKFGADTATRAVWLMAAYPFALFHGQVYAESLFLAAAVGAWYSFESDAPIPATAWAIVAGLTKPTGCLVAILIAFAALAQWRAGRLSGRRIWIAVGVIAAPAIGLLLYAASMKVMTGSWLTWLAAQGAWGRHAGNPVDLIVTIATTIHQQGVARYVLDHPYEALNLAAALAGLAAVVPVTRRVGIGAGLFTAISLMVPLGFGGLVSLGRFTCVLFPVFMWLATISRSPALPALFAGGQGVLAALFFTDRGIF
jgi:hypothetical protein